MTAPEAYLALLRAALWGTDIPAWEDIAPVFDEVLELCDGQKTRGLVFDLLLRSGYPVPAETAGRMQQLLYRILNTHRKLNAAIARVVSVLQEADIPCVLLKGQGVARFYPNPLLRECGDIDLYVGTERLESAVKVLAPLADKVDDQITGKHWQLWIGSSEIELHRYTMVPESRSLIRYFKGIETEGLSQDLVPLNFDGVSVNIPENTFNAFYTFYHTWYHFTKSGVGFRQLCDWVRLMHVCRESIDRTRLSAMLKGMRLLGPWRLFGCIAVQDLGLPAEEFPFYDETPLSKSRRVLDLILSYGNFGQADQHRRQRPKGYLSGKLFSFGTHIRQFFLLQFIAPGEAFRIFSSRFAESIRRVFKDLFHR